MISTLTSLQVLAQTQLPALEQKTAQKLNVDDYPETAVAPPRNGEGQREK
jgi:hypothetical protein